MKLQDKVVVITGAGRGLGKSLATKLAKENTKLVISAETEEQIKTLAKEINCLAIQADVSTENDVQNLADQVVKQFGAIDIWINNAGIWIPHGPVESLDTKRLVKMFKVNVFGLIYGSKSALTQMRKQSSGVILNIISTSALSGRPNSSAYCASKFAASGFTKSLQEETKSSDIQAIAAYPGGMKTNLFDEAKPKDYDAYMSPDYVADILIDNLKSDKPQEEIIIKRP